MVKDGLYLKKKGSDFSWNVTFDKCTLLRLLCLCWPSFCVIFKINVTINYPISQLIPLLKRKMLIHRKNKSNSVSNWMCTFQFSHIFIASALHSIQLNPSRSPKFQLVVPFTATFWLSGLWNTIFECSLVRLSGDWYQIPFLAINSFCAYNP